MVVDLDNTLWDWVSVWYQSFSAMLAKIAEISGRSEDELKPHIQAVFREHGTSEYAFVIEELDVLAQNGESPAAVRDRYDAAVEAHREARAKSLEPYPGVRETLQTLRANGVVLVGYTESMVVYSTHRLVRLGLDGMLDYLYAPEDHEIPFGRDRSDLAGAGLQLDATKIRFTPPGVLKPAPQILTQILDEVGVEPGRAIYVGDSLMKDVAMAEQAGVYSVLAAYGKAQDRAQYKLLQDVSHWSDADIARETAINAAPVHTPKAVLNDFADLLDLGTFGPAPSAARGARDV